jgi:diguanylate cyclase (GGDEF)-like protein
MSQVTQAAPQMTEDALNALEEASAEHLAWLKQIHCALLFHGDTKPPEAKCRPEDGLAAKVGDHFGENRAAFLRLKQARSQMETMARELTHRAGRGERLEPATYMAFMEAVEAYHSEARQVELLLHQSLAETDPLTGLHNRRGMMRDLHREWIRATRTGNPCCLALVDLDFFKLVNDQHGHLTGDRVLADAARFFVRRLRPYDMVYRYGGEEFVFCLPNTELRLARRVLDRLRLLMARLPLRAEDGQRLTVTISIGLAEITPDIPPETALARADQALYAAKTSGRNKVCVTEDEE